MSQDALDLALYDDDPVVRDTARQTISQHADTALIKQLIACLDAPQRLTRRRTAAVLSDIPPSKVRRPLVDTLGDENAPVRARVAAARILVAQADGLEPSLADGFSSKEERVRRACMTPLTPPETLLAGLTDPDAEVVARSAQSLLTIEYEVDPAYLETNSARWEDAPPPLIRLVAKYSPTAPILKVWADAGKDAALDHLADETELRNLMDSDPVTAAWGLSRSGSVDPRMLSHSDPRVRAAAARCADSSQDALRRLSEDPDPSVRWLARRALVGYYAEGQRDVHTAPHARMDSPSAKPPYGLRPDDVLPDVERVHAAVALCQARFDINLGVAMRSAEAAGLEAVYFVGRGDFVRSPARGADLAIPVHHQPDAAALIRTARQEGYQIVAVQQTAGSVPYHQADYPPNPLFVVGAEDVGMPNQLREEADLNVEIPQFGIIDSLNVAAALTVVIFHWRVHRPG